MSDAAAPGEVLSREELDALLASLAEERSEQERREAGSPFAKAKRARPRKPALPALLRAFEWFALQQGRTLSSTYQTKVVISILGWDESTLHELADLLLPSDRVAAFEVGDGGHVGHLLIARPLVFTWLELAFGSKAGSPRLAPPRRPYTRIEERFLRRLSAEVLSVLERALKELVSGSLRLVGLEDAERLRERPATPVLLASLDLTGLGEVCRLRFALPIAAFADLVPASQPAMSGDEISRVARTVLEVPVTLRAEVGTAELTLARLAGLRPGEVIPIERSDGAELVLRVDGPAKFRAMRGAIGRRLAVQVTERL